VSRAWADRGRCPRRELRPREAPARGGHSWLLCLLAAASSAWRFDSLSHQTLTSSARALATPEEFFLFWSCRVTHVTDTHLQAVYAIADMDML